MFKKNKRKYIKLGNVTDKKKEQEEIKQNVKQCIGISMRKKEQERKQKQQRCNLTFDGEKFYKAFNEFKDDIL